MFKTIGICGIGNMGRAIAQGLAESGLIDPASLLLYNIHEEKAQKVAGPIGATVVTDAQTLTKQSQCLILAVKPNIMPSVMAEIKDAIAPDTVVISIAAGLTLQRLADALPAGCKIVRSMPNTPVMVGEGMASLTANEFVTADEQAAVLAIFESFGKAEYMDEHLIDAVCGLSGSGPAYVYMFIEALADGAVAEGMPRPKAYTFAAQTVLGAAKMVLTTGEHPGKLKDDVCSPGGNRSRADAGRKGLPRCSLGSGHRLGRKE